MTNLPSRAWRAPHTPFGLVLSSFVIASLAAACGSGNGGSGGFMEPPGTPTSRDGGSGSDAGGPVSEPPAPSDDAGTGEPDPGAPDAGGVDGAPPPATCAGSSTWAPGFEQTITLTSGGTSRTYLAHVGKGVTAGQPAPLLVNVHGLNNSPQIQVGFSGMNAIADSKGFVVVYPQGISASFNAGGCCGTAASQNIDDVGFIRAIVKDVESKICVDARRVYATGFSNGGYMSHRLGCEASDVFAAIAPVSGANTSPTCNPTHPMPVIAFHGDADPIVSYASGKDAVAGWVKRDECTGDPTHTTFGSSSCDEWATCAGGVKVKLCTIAGGSHLWPSGGSIPASPAIWDFVSQFRLP